MSSRHLVCNGGDCKPEKSNGNNMKVLHINCNYIGTTLHQKMIEALEKQGISNDVFVPTYDKHSSVITVNENVTVSECFNKIDRLIFIIDIICLFTILKNFFTI